MKLYSPQRPIAAPPIARRIPPAPPMIAPMTIAAPPTTIRATFCPAPRWVSAAVVVLVPVFAADGARIPIALAATVGPAVRSVEAGCGVDAEAGAGAGVAVRACE